MTQNGYTQGPPIVECANGHPCNQYVTNCSICGAAVMDKPVQRATLTCSQGHATEGHQGPDGTWYCTVCFATINPAQLPASQVHYSPMGKPVPNRPVQRVVTPGYSYQPPPQLLCPNGHPNSKTAKFCATCGVAMPVPTTTQHERIMMASNGEELPPLQDAPAAYQGPRTYAYQLAALPTVWPTVLVTFFFGIFGLIPASMHTSRAREAGRPTNTYWAAFGWTMAASILLWVLFLVVIASSVHTTTYYYPYQ